MKIYIVKYSDGYDYNGVVCAFSDKAEADKYAEILRQEAVEVDGPEIALGFYSMEYDLYNNIEERAEEFENEN